MDSLQNQGKQESLWTKDFTKIGATNFFDSICIQVLITIFPLFLNAKGFNAATIGTVASLYTICAMIMRFTSGNLIDRVGRRKVGVIGAVLFAVSLAGILLVSFFEEPLNRVFSVDMGNSILTFGMILIIAMRMLQGFGAATVTIATSTMAADVLPRARFAEGIGYYGLFNSLATAFGPALGIALVALNSDLTFGLMLVIMLLALFMMSSLKYESDPSYLATVRESEAAEGEKFVSDTHGLWKFFEKKALPAAMILFCMAVSVAGVQNFLTLYASSIGLSGIGFYFTIQAAFMILSRLSSGKMAARLGTYKAIFIGLFIVAIAFFGLSFARNIVMLYICAAVYGFGAGLCFPMLQVLTMSGVSRARRGTANSTYLASWDIGSGLGAAIWGYTIDFSGSYSLIYLLSGIIMVLDLLMAFYLSKKYPSEI